jgi:hypothetical protein
MKTPPSYPIRKIHSGRVSIGRALLNVPSATKRTNTLGAILRQQGCSNSRMGGGGCVGPTAVVLLIAVRTQGLSVDVKGGFAPARCALSHGLLLLLSLRWVYHVRNASGKEVQFCTCSDYHLGWTRVSVGSCGGIALRLVLFVTQDAMGEIPQRKQGIVGADSPVTQLESIIRRHGLAVLK